MKKLLFLALLAAGSLTACQQNSTDADTVQGFVNVAPSDKTPIDKVKAQTVALKTSGYAVGDVAEDFKLKNIDGSMVSLSDYPKAKGFVVVFTCNSCPYAVKYEDRLIELNKATKAKGYPVIAINPNDPDVQPADSFDKMIVRAKEKGFEFPYLFDEGQSVYPKFGATKTPHVFLLSKDMVVEYIGAIDNSPNDPANVTEKYVENAIAALENGGKPNPNLTKAIGCSVKAKK
jgi:peroxiredoxin